jgi:coenzyme F420-reducing hydrogenase beta subunit
MSSVIEKIRRVDGAFAFVGLPCMVKAIHLLRRVDTEIAAKIKYTVGIVCGQLKSMNWTELLAWQAGIEPKNLTGVRFRELPSAGSTAKDYRFRYFSPKYTTGVAADTKGAVGANWAHAVQMIEACEYCDDVVGETADISIGDAWLSRYISDRYGTNLVITRSKELGDLIQRGSESGALWIEQLTHDEAIATQAGALRMRREGLAYRLWLREQNGEWHPTKRVRPSRTHIPKRRRRVYEVRALIRSRSVRLFAAAKETGNLSVFQRAIRRATRRHDRLSNPMYRRLLRAVLRRLRG